MIKAKAKAERAAARAAAQAPLIAAGLIAPPPVTPTPDEAPADAETPQEGETASAAPTPAPGRTEILRSKASVVARFMQLTVPILIDVYAASVNTPVRVKALTGLLKAVSYLDADGVKEVLKVSLPIFLPFAIS